MMDGTWLIPEVGHLRSCDAYGRLIASKSSLPRSVRSASINVIQVWRGYGVLNSRRRTIND
jgi:hypothetical protein